MRRVARHARLIAPLTLLAVPSLLVAALIAMTASGCRGGSVAGGSLDVIASATFLADIAQNVAGDRFTLRALVPANADLHAYEPTPHDVADVAGADLFIVNGAGLEQTLEDTVRSAGGKVRIVEASAGLASRTPRAGEPGAPGAGTGDDASAAEPDPHFWLDPTLVTTYVENIRVAFAAADPQGAATYQANADRYVTQLGELDRWIRAQVDTVPASARKLVMNHMSHGYFADRYGFTIVGAVIPSVGTGDTPTARQLADLTRTIRETGAKAIFVELDQSPALATQVAAETGIAVVADLRDHALSGPDGEAPTYIAMMKYDTRRIVEALR